MKYNVLGESELSVSEICLGTMTFGEQNSEAEAHQQLDYAVSRGVNFFDAAEMYPVPPRAQTQGSTECYVGSWLKNQPRDKVIVATKITAPGRGFEWVRGGPKAIDQRSVEEAVNGSLQRLQTDYVAPLARRLQFAHSDRPRPNGRSHPEWNATDRDARRACA